MTARERAIAYAEEHRQIHVTWVDHLRRYPPRTREERITRSAAGGITHHLGAIRRYDTILRVLRQT